jgi:hypothetical protein
VIYLVKFSSNGLVTEFKSLGGICVSISILGLWFGFKLIKGIDLDCYIV